jgi:hypothetical protein
MALRPSKYLDQPPITPRSRPQSPEFGFVPPISSTSEVRRRQPHSKLASFRQVPASRRPIPPGRLDWLVPKTHVVETTRPIWVRIAAARPGQHPGPAYAAGPRGSSSGCRPLTGFLCGLCPLCALNSWVFSVSPRLCGEPSVALGSIRPRQRPSRLPNSPLSILNSVSRRRFFR